MRTLSYGMSFFVKRMEDFQLNPCRYFGLKFTDLKKFRNENTKSFGMKLAKALDCFMF